jgi:hypothetical protein
MEVSGQLHTSAALLLGKEPPYPLNISLDEPQCRSGRGDDKFFPCSSQESNLGPSVLNPATELLWLQKHYLTCRDHKVPRYIVSKIAVHDQENWSFLASKHLYPYTLCKTQY